MNILLNDVFFLKTDQILSTKLIQNWYNSVDSEILDSFGWDTLYSKKFKFNFSHIV